MRRRILGGACLLLLVGLWPLCVQAQTDVCLWSATLRTGADITVDATAGGVEVLPMNPKRCAAIIQNIGTADMRCGSATDNISATIGFVVKPGATLQFLAEGREPVRCVRTTGASTIVSTLEAISR